MTKQRQPLSVPPHKIIIPAGADSIGVRPVRVQEAHTIYDIPSGWKVNGTTTSGTYQAKGGDVLHFTPTNIPSGKKIKSIKVVKK